MKKIAIIGYGRFGKVLHQLLKDDFDVALFHHDDSPQDIFATANTIFYCVPIAAFEKTISKHSAYYTKEHLLIDVLSVKEHPKKILKKYLSNTHARALLTHPMFGPDSTKNGYKGLPIVLDQNTSTKEEYIFWKQYFIDKGLHVVELSAYEHDKLAAYSQGLTHFIGRLLEKMKFTRTSIDTVGARQLHEVVDHTCNDSWQLFMNLQNYNAYTKQMRIQLGRAYDSIYNSLLPSRVSRNHLVFGIQGGKGSFSEEAILDYLEKNGVKKYKIKYLYTSEKVLKGVHEGSVDFGLFAIHNAAGGVVDESTYAMSRYKFTIFKEHAILVRHFLMKRKDINETEIKTVRAHPQVFRQCTQTLEIKYPHLQQLTGEGDLIDTAVAAKALAHGRVAKNTYILGPGILASLYGFDIVASDLQDLQNNITSFFLVKR